MRLFGSPPLVLRSSGGHLSHPPHSCCPGRRPGHVLTQAPDIRVLRVLAARCPHPGSAPSLPSLGTLRGLTGVHRHLQSSPPGPS